MGGLGMADGREMPGTEMLMPPPKYGKHNIVRPTQLIILAEYALLASVGMLLLPGTEMLMPPPKYRKHSIVRPTQLILLAEYALFARA